MFTEPEYFELRIVQSDQVRIIYRGENVSYNTAGLDLERF